MCTLYLVFLTSVRCVVTSGFVSHRCLGPFVGCSWSRRSKTQQSGLLRGTQSGLWLGGRHQLESFTLQCLCRIWGPGSVLPSFVLLCYLDHVLIYLFRLNLSATQTTASAISALQRLRSSVCPTVPCPYHKRSAPPNQFLQLATDPGRPGLGLKLAKHTLRVSMLEFREVFVCRMVARGFKEWIGFQNSWIRRIHVQAFVMREYQRSQAHKVFFFFPRAMMLLGQFSLFIIRRGLWIRVHVHLLRSWDWSLVLFTRRVWEILDLWQWRWLPTVPRNFLRNS